MVTLDGVEYTFNGYGEYTLLKVGPIAFDLQGRMEPLPTRDGRQINATVYTAFAMKENGSDTIEVLNWSTSRDVGPLFVTGEGEIQIWLMLNCASSFYDVHNIRCVLNYL